MAGLDPQHWQQHDAGPPTPATQIRSRRQHPASTCNLSMDEADSWVRVQGCPWSFVAVDVPTDVGQEACGGGLQPAVRLRVKHLIFGQVSATARRAAVPGPCWLECTVMPVRYRQTVDDAWRSLRSLRHDPPPHADRGGRKALFAAALEQSEQLFRAADGVGYETKPILLYYGLNQASRAILEAKRDPRQQGAPSSHGIKTPNLGQDPKVGDLELADDGTSGSFGQLADVLDSPTLPGRVPLRQLWIGLPEGVEVPPTNAEKLFGAALMERADDQEFSDRFRETTGRVAKLAHMPFLLAPLDAAEVERQIVERYPALRNFHAIPNRQHCPEVAHWVQLLDPPGLRVSLSFDRKGAPMKHDEVRGMMHLGPRAYADYSGAQLWIPPTLPGNSAPLHPLVTWWAVLFALSMLARYQPTNWTRSISIDTSADATALEHLIDTAHLACVNLIARLFAVEHPDQPDELRQYHERVRKWMLSQQQART